MLGSGEGGEDYQAMRIGKSLEKHGIGGAVGVVERGGRATALHRHVSILPRCIDFYQCTLTVPIFVC
jgi:hypothetical protein